jgi:hypothetical protein
MGGSRAVTTPWIGREEEIRSCGMDVQAQDSGFHRVNAGVPASTRTDAITFHQPVYADTAPTPVVAYRPPRRRQKDSSGVRLLRAAVVVVAVAVLACGAILGLVKAGVIHRPGNVGAGNVPSAQNAGASKAPLAVPVGSGPLTASYAVDAGAFVLTIATGPGAAWVSVGLVGQHPVFTGVLSPHTSRGFPLLGSSQVEVGAGGTTITLMSGHRTATLIPPVAPFTYQLAAHQARA